ncbi:MAG: glycoside hydrolase family 28 protein [Lachnospiraceae bacterium]|nr:glycoside hydrolase family 28 protein [Lachnospiraceae bacterium]
MIECLYVSSTSGCFELKNNLPYYNAHSYNIILNGEIVERDRNTNVFSLFNLTPDTEYTVEVEGDDAPLTFTTKPESCCINVKAFGAAGDGVKNDTNAIQTAIACLPKDGRLYFPEGTYLVTPLFLKSYITLEFAKGATLLGSTDKSKYPVIPGEITDERTGKSIPFGTFEGLERSMYQSLIFAEYAKHIRIIGQGCIDGNAQNGTWWQTFKDDPVSRPRLLYFNRCEHITVLGMTVQNSPSWQLHPYFSKYINFLDLEINAPKDSPNTDACDPEACDNVNIIGCRFSVGDDCIAIKSGKIEVGRKYKQAADHHTIKNCLMQFGHGAVTLGSEMAGGVKNLTVNRCIFNSTDRGLRIKTRRGRGKDAVIDGVLFENIKMTNVLTPIVINMWYNCCDPDRFEEYVWSREKLPVDDRTPFLGKFTFKDMTCEDCHVAACYCDGLPEQPIEEITVSNISFTYSPDAKPGKPAMRNYAEEFCKAGLYFDNVKTLNISNINITGVEGEKYILKNIGKTNIEE